MKRFVVAVAVALTALAVAAPASAHRASVEITCNGVTFTYQNFPAGVTASSAETVVVDGTTVYSDTFPITPPGGSHTVPLSIVGNAHVEATFIWTSSDRRNPVRGGGEEDVECGDTTGGTTGGDTGGDTGGTTGGDTTGGDTTGGGTTGGGTTGGGTGGGGGTTGTGGAIGNTTGGTPGSETGGELPFTGLPIWVPVLLAAGLLGGGVFLLRRRRDDVS
jgi:hypothetical protein